MDINVKDIESWDETEKWLSKHGYGLEQIRMIKEEFLNSKASNPVAETKVVTKVTTPSVKK